MSILRPIFALTALLVLGLVWGWWWQAALWIVLQYPLMLFAWHDGMWMRRTWEQLCMRVFKSKANRLRSLYDRFYGLVKELIG